MRLRVHGPHMHLFRRLARWDWGWRVPVRRRRLSGHGGVLKRAQQLLSSGSDATPHARADAGAYAGADAPSHSGADARSNDT